MNWKSTSYLCDNHSSWWTFEWYRWLRYKSLMWSNLQWLQFDISVVIHISIKCVIDSTVFFKYHRQIRGLLEELLLHWLDLEIYDSSWNFIWHPLNRYEDLSISCHTSFVWSIFWERIYRVTEFHHSSWWYTWMISMIVLSGWWYLSSSAHTLQNVRIMITFIDSPSFDTKFKIADDISSSSI